MGLPPIPAPRLTQGASRAGFWRAAALYDKRLLPPSLYLAIKLNGNSSPQKSTESTPSAVAIKHLMPHFFF